MSQKATIVQCLEKLASKPHYLHKFNHLSEDDQNAFSDVALTKLTDLRKKLMEHPQNELTETRLNKKTLVQLCFLYVDYENGKISINIYLLYVVFLKYIVLFFSVLL